MCSGWPQLLFPTSGPASWPATIALLQEERNISNINHGAIFFCTFNLRIVERAVHVVPLKRTYQQNGCQCELIRWDSVSGSLWRDKFCQPADVVYRLRQLVPVEQTVRSGPQSFTVTTQRYLAGLFRVYLLGSEWQTAGGCGVCGAGTVANNTEWRRHTETGSCSSDPPANLAVRQQPGRLVPQRDQSP